jgi:hypothetical protein
MECFAERGPADPRSDVGKLPKLYFHLGAGRASSGAMSFIADDEVPINSGIRRDLGVGGGSAQIDAK